MPSNHCPAVVLLSGGIDSATAAAVAVERGFAVHALTFRYGQRHVIEVEAARRVAAMVGAVGHVIVDLDLGGVVRSALTGQGDVPRDRPREAIARDIPPTYVPARNTIFLAYGLAMAETIGAFDIFIGANALDYSGYPDCRPEFIARFEELANVATAAGVTGRGRFTIHAPLIRMTKAEIIREGVRLGVDYSVTVSCYDPAAGGRACGRCDSCLLRKRGFAEAGVPDPTQYAEAAQP